MSRGNGNGTGLPGGAKAALAVVLAVLAAIGVALLIGRAAGFSRVRDEVSVELVPEQSVRAEETVLRLTIQRALDELPEGMRRVVVLHDVEGYTHEEIGAELGISPGTSKSQLFKARAKLGRLLRGGDTPVNGEEVCLI